MKALVLNALGRGFDFEDVDIATPVGHEVLVEVQASGLCHTDLLFATHDIVPTPSVLGHEVAGVVAEVGPDVAQIRAAVAEAEATLAEASANAQRARTLQTTGALSDAQIHQYLTAERTAQARLEAQRANANMQQLRLKMTQVLAPDNGVIFASYIGSWLMAGAFLALAAAISALTKSQVLAFIGATAVSFLFVMAGFDLVIAAVRSWAPPVIIDAVRSMSFLGQFQRIAEGVLELPSIIFFVSLIAFCLWLNVLAIDVKKAA